MSKDTIDGIGYYTSCLIPLNFICFIRILQGGLLGSIGQMYESLMDHKFPVVSMTEWINYAMSVLVLGMIVFGIYSTIVILKNDDNKRGERTTGENITPIDTKDLTAENYFSNISLFMLTGLSIPVWEHWDSLILYLTIIFMLGVVYIKEKMVYINPILTINNYRVYSCKDKESEKIYTFVVKEMCIKDGQPVEFKKTGKTVIRLNGNNMNTK